MFRWRIKTCVFKKKLWLIPYHNKRDKSLETTQIYWGSCLIETTKMLGGRTQQKNNPSKFLDHWKYLLLKFDLISLDSQFLLDFHSWPSIWKIVPFYPVLVQSKFQIQSFPVVETNRHAYWNLAFHPTQEESRI